MSSNDGDCILWHRIGPILGNILLDSKLNYSFLGAFDTVDIFANVLARKDMFHDVEHRPHLGIMAVDW